MIDRCQLLVTLVLVVSLVVAVSCWQARPGLDEYCSDDPRAATCPDDVDGCRPYECASYCIRHEMVAADWAPSSGMGSWCSTLTEDDVCGICLENSEVVGCVSFLATSCSAPDGDADVDVDSDTDTDGDSDGESEGQCATNGDCSDPARPRCADDGSCVVCEAPGDCALHGALDTCDPDNGACVECLDNGGCGEGEPICHEETQECVECRMDRDCGYHSPPRVCNHRTSACVAGCVECASNEDCEELAGPNFYCVQYDVTLPYVPTTHIYQNCLEGVPAGDELSCERPYRLVTGISTSVAPAGAPLEVDACLPPLPTSCAALRNLGNLCPDDYQCGMEPPDSAYPEWMCWGDMAGTETICSYYCGVDVEGVLTATDELCPEGFHCSDLRNDYCAPNPS